MKGTDTMFSISPRKIFFVDQEADVETNMVFTTNNYNLTNYCKLNKISLDDLNETHVKNLISYPKSR